MSEADRSRLYALLREHIEEPLAEYVMSCLAPAPLTDLVTKDYLDTVLEAKFSAFALTLAEQREADRKEAAAQREADLAQAAAQREADRKEAAAQRAADLETAGKRHRLLVGAAIMLAAEIVAAEAGWLRWFTHLLATVG